MDISLIPPIKHLPIAKGFTTHLILSHMLENTRYRDFYAQERRQGALIILDNSAHEFQKGQPMPKLVAQATDINAQEIVLPDHLFSCSGTITSTQAAIQFLHSEGDRYPHLLKPDTQYMIVPQAQSFDEYGECLRALLDLYYYQGRGRNKLLFNNPVTIGVSKDYEKWDGGLYRILEKIVFPTLSVYDKDIRIHMLGWGRDIWALDPIGRDFGDRIRSVDSAKALVYAHAGIRLDPDHTEIPAYPTRPENYFDEVLPPEYVKIAQHNINMFRLCSLGQLHDTEVRRSL